MSVNCVRPLADIRMKNLRTVEIGQQVVKVYSRTSSGKITETTSPQLTHTIEKAAFVSQSS
jgi:hypothetical protein